MRNVIFLLLLFIFLTLPILVLPRLIIVKDITCINQFGPCSSYLDGEVQREVGQNLKQLEKSLGKVLGSQIQVVDFSFKFHFPDKLKVYVVERKPVVAFNFNGDFYLVDQDNYVVAVVKETNLPTVFIREKTYSFNAGDKVSDELVFVSELLQKLFIAYSVKVLYLEAENLEVNLDSLSVIFPTSGNPDILIGSLRFILSQLNTRSEDIRIGKVSTIDLRFKNPVIR